MNGVKAIEAEATEQGKRGHPSVQNETTDALALHVSTSHRVSKRASVWERVKEIVHALKGHASYCISTMQLCMHAASQRTPRFLLMAAAAAAAAG